MAKFHPRTGRRALIFEPTSLSSGFDNLTLTSCPSAGTAEGGVRTSYIRRGFKNPLRSHIASSVATAELVFLRPFGDGDVRLPREQPPQDAGRGRRHPEPCDDEAHPPRGVEHRDHAAPLRHDELREPQHEEAERIPPLE